LSKRSGIKDEKIKIKRKKLIEGKRRKINDMNYIN